MLTRKALNRLLQDVFDALSALGYEPERMILFGSYASGSPGPYSDVDIAVWHTDLTSNAFEDLDRIQSVIRKFVGVDLRTYPSGATAENFDPFSGVIEETGIVFRPGVPAV